MHIASATRALGNDAHNGDQCAYWQSGGGTTLCIVDGLGHGEHAEAAARTAVDFVAQHMEQRLEDLFSGCAEALRYTRGAVMGVAVVDAHEKTLTYAGIGNTRAVIVRSANSEPHSRSGPTTFRFRSNPGIVGAGFRRLSPQTASLSPGDLLMLYTDGLPELLDVDVHTYDTAHLIDPNKLAQNILRDWSLETDDAALLVCVIEET